MRKLNFALFAIALGCAAPALAQSWGALLRGSAYERFNDQDKKLFRDNARKALNQAKDGETMAWENPKTRRHGDVTVLKTSVKDGKTCKQVQVRNEADGRKGENLLDLCQIDGRWRLLAPPAPSK